MSAPADAGTVEEFQLPGRPEQQVHTLATGPDDSVWFAQDQDVTRNNNTETSRVARMLSNGTVVTSVQLSGSAPFIGLQSDGAGGVWALMASAKTLHHISLDGSHETYTIPPKPDVSFADQPATFYAKMIDGRDTSVFALVENVTDRSWSVEILRPGAAPVFVPLPGTGFDIYEDLIADDDGVWIAGRGAERRSVFVTSTGAVRETHLPDGQGLVAGGPGDTAWTARDNLISLVRPDSSIAATHTLPAARYPAQVGPAPGGAVTFGVFSPFDDTADGFAGIATASVVNTLRVPSGEISYRDPVTGKYPAACTFGISPIVGPDGGIWSISGGHPGHVIYTKGDDVRNFIAPGQRGSKESGFYNRAMTTHYAWFSLDYQDQSPALVRVDAIDVPPGLPTFADAHPENNRPPAPRPSTTTLTRALSRALRAVGPSLRRLRTAGVLTIGPLDLRGVRRTSVRVQDKAGRPLATGSSSGVARAHITIRLTAYGRSQIRAHARLPVVVWLTARSTSAVRSRKVARSL